MLNVPSPNPERVSYARFIPREELGDFANWSPDTFGQLRPPARHEPEPEIEAPAPTEEEWLQQIDAARQVGYEEGYRDGLVALEGFKRSHAQQVDAQVAEFVQHLNEEFDGLHAQLAAAITRVSVHLARQVLRSELTLSPALVARVAGEAVESVLLSARHITVHVHPDDLPLVAQGAQEVLQARGARLIAQPSIERGGCRVESDAGAIDARIATRWAQAAGALGSDEDWDDPAAAGDTP
jgi:flagellar assembly protein FliH